MPNAQLAWAFSDESGHPVVQLHGLTSSRAHDRLLQLDLGRALSGTQLLRYDARGHGYSSGRPVPADYRWPVLAEDLLQLLDYWFPDQPVHGVGPSMGCGTLLHAAVRRPERFSGFTLMLPPTAWDTRPAQAQRYLESADQIERLGMGTYFAQAPSAGPPPAASGAPAVLPHVPDHLLPAIYRGAALSDLPSRDELRRVTAPTRILAWVDDPGHPLSTAQELARLLPAATLQVARTPQDLARWPQLLAEDVARYRG
ncbi:alpha/beta fold hydrolase [Glutamicibacter sp. NPDC087344]|uniref:alpha/beta fold hydrolase n=1 Tax=Glutamicibacter sp. NPDC087344 TaxID=3363994 RepID=UPI0037FB9A84